MGISQSRDEQWDFMFFKKKSLKARTALSRIFTIFPAIVKNPTKQKKVQIDKFPKALAGLWRGEG